MKAGDLAKLLMEHPDFEVRLVFFDDEFTHAGYRKFKIEGICDIGFADKLINLGGKEG